MDAEEDAVEVVAGGEGAEFPQALPKESDDVDLVWLRSLRDPFPTETFDRDALECPGRKDVGGRQGGREVERPGSAEVGLHRSGGSLISMSSKKKRATSVSLGGQGAEPEERAQQAHAANLHP